MTDTTRSERPIGYWFKRADQLLTEQINRAHAANGVSRSEWQVLTMLSTSGETTREQIFATMRTFVDASGLDAIVAALAERGWIELVGAETGAGRLRLSAEGRRRHEALFAAQQDVRRRAMQGISEEEYVTVIRVLQRLVGNLEGTERAG